jgi:hypothetical protein
VKSSSPFKSFREKIPTILLQSVFPEITGIYQQSKPVVPLAGTGQLKAPQQMSKETYMSETKNAYVERQRGNLKSWNAEIDKFQARADRATDKLLDKLNKHIVELKEKRTDLDSKVSDIQKAGEEGWEVLKEDADKTFKSLDKLFKTVTSLFN